MSKSYRSSAEIASEMWFRNFYRCPRCGTEWEDEWDATCDDDCGHCGLRHISPYLSEDLPQDPPSQAMDAEAAMRELVADLQARGDEAILDDLVHDVAAQAPSAINNEGFQAQVRFLVVTLGWPAAYAAIKNLLEVNDG